MLEGIAEQKEAQPFYSDHKGTIISNFPNFSAITFYEADTLV